MNLQILELSEADKGVSRDVRDVVEADGQIP